jgi:6-phosphofructokinase
MTEGAGDSSHIVKEIKERTRFDVRLTILGHALRGGP